MNLLSSIAVRHLLARRRQSIVSLFGIVLGVAFFLAISSLMQGSERDFIKRLVDNAPHISIADEYRNPRFQPIYLEYPAAAVSLRGVKPVTEPRGIRGYDRIVRSLRARPGVLASPTLVGQALATYAGKDYGITLNGVIASQINEVTTIHEHMISGTVEDLIGDANGIIIGSELAKKLSLERGNNLSVATPGGTNRVFKVVGIFRTGRSNYDESQAFAAIERVQAIFGKVHRANDIIVHLSDPYDAVEVAADIEHRIGYKSVSWQESSEDLMNTLKIRNTIMYTVVSAVLVVAAFGIYNVISTVVMEKHRDIAILKSMGFHASDIQRIFLVQGLVLGIAGSSMGLPLGSLFMWGLGHIRFKPPGASEPIAMPIDWSPWQFALAASFALTAATLAALLPARKGARVQPVEILRGGA